MHSTTTAPTRPIDVAEIADHITAGQFVTPAEWEAAQLAVGWTPRRRVRDEFDPPGSPAYLPSGPIPSDGARLRAALAGPSPVARLQAKAFGIKLPAAAVPAEPAPCCAPAEAAAGEPREPSGEGYGMPAWTLGPDQIEGAPADAAGDEPAMTFAGLVEWNIRAFRSLNSDAGDLMAEALGELLTEIEITGARTPGQLRDRRACLDVAE